MSDSAPLGKLIREKRKAAGLPLRHVADALGISVPYLSDVELGHRKPAAKRWKALAETIPGLTVRAIADAAIASGPVEIDASKLTPAQRKGVVDALVRLAEDGP